MPKLSPNDGLVPFYRARPIGSVHALALTLGISKAGLLFLAESADRSYTTVKEIVKADGTKRQTFDAFPALKDLQRRIHHRILSRVAFPPYLHGSLKGRGTRSNATIHQGARLCVTEDIENYFPSISAVLVHRIWLRLFGFSPEVCDLLTRLTIRLGELPQGAITSPAIANLALWEHEPTLVRQLEAKGYRYSRFVDDISVSATVVIDDEEKRFIVGSIYAMLRKHGLRPKRQKHKITTSRDRITATKIVIKPDSIGLTPAVRSNVKAAVFQLEQRATFGEFDQTFQRLLASAACRVGRLKYFHPEEAKQLKARVDAVRKRFRAASHHSPS